MLCPECGEMTFINRTVMDYEGRCRIRVRICKRCQYRFLTEEWAIRDKLTHEQMIDRIRDKRII